MTFLLNMDDIYECKFIVSLEKNKSTFLFLFIYKSMFAIYDMTKFSVNNHILKIQNDYLVITFVLFVFDSIYGIYIVTLVYILFDKLLYELTTLI